MTLFFGLFAQLKNLFDEWEIRCLVLFSLFLQIVLIFSADHRKRNVSWLLNSFLWLAYVLADSVAIFALGILAHSQNDQRSSSPSGAVKNNETLRAFWSPFLLLHLGGPDTITALSLEDNELWLRHMLNLLVQMAIAVYVFTKSLFLSTTWLLPSLFMFVTGLLKYGERTWALFSASMDHFTSSLFIPPVAGLNYAKFMENYSSSLSAGLHAKIATEFRPDPITPHDTLEGSQKSPQEIVLSAYSFFLTFQRLIADLILTFEDRTKSQAFFLKGLSAKEAFKVVEIELSFIYDVLYTKSAVIHTIIGRLTHLTTFIFSIISLLLFFLLDKRGYNPKDVSVTYTLAIGALVLQFYAMFYAIASFWTYNWLYNCKYTTLASLVFRLSNIFRLYSQRSWSDFMAGYNLFSLIHKDKRYVTLGNIMCCIGLKNTWRQFLHTEHRKVPYELKEVIFRELKLKIGFIKIDPTCYKYCTACRGEWVLRQKGYYKHLRWSVEAEFDDCVLLWHIAIDLCLNYNSTENNTRDAAAPQDINNTENNTRDEAEQSLKDISQAVSDYLLYLLLERPFMLIMHGNTYAEKKWQIRYDDTCAEMKHYFEKCEKEKKKKSASIDDVYKMLLDVSTDYRPRNVNGGRSKSVLFDACRLAKELMKIEEKKTRWEVISLVFVEMLCFAATKGSGNFHAKQLSHGGELLTHVWILMAHMGFGEEWNAIDHAKLFVAK